MGRTFKNNSRGGSAGWDQTTEEDSSVIITGVEE
jgi:hypothetical protein